MTASVNTTSASCTAEGNKKYTATFDNIAFETQTKNVSIPETNHEYTELKTENGEHWYECVCGEKQLPKEVCYGGTATCTEQAVCSTCNVPYGETDAHAYGEASYTWSDDYTTCTAERICLRNSEHIEREEQNSTYTDGKATVSFTNTAFSAQTVVHIDATQMTANELKVAVAYMLSKGETDIKVTMAETPDAKMFTAIRRALIDTEGVKDGSIHLTLKGVTTIPDHDEFDPSTAIFGVIIPSDGEGEKEVVSQLASVNLPDVTYIGKQAFFDCSLTSLTAPKLKEVGEDAFAFSKLTSVELPEVTTIGGSAFSGCTDLTSVKLPKATSIGRFAFWVCRNMTSLELTADGEITMGTNALRSDDLGKCDLVLNEDKKSAVEGTTWNGYTFANVMYTCTDGSTDHTNGPAVSNGDGTHSLTCTTCNQTKVNHCHGGEATCQKLAVCEECGVQYGGVSDHMTDPATGYCKFGCGEFVAAAKITLGETTTYYKTLTEFLNEKQNGATITLLKDVEGEYIDWFGCVVTLDLNGFNLKKNGGYEVKIGEDGGEVSLVNTAEKRAGITSAFVYFKGDKFTVGNNVDIEAIYISQLDATIDLSAADFTSTTIKANGDGFNVSQITLGHYAVYDADGNVVTGELTKDVIYTIKAAE